MDHVRRYWEDDSSGDDRPPVAFRVNDQAVEQREITVPTTAEEYLVMVRRTAGAMPNVFVADAPAPPPPSTCTHSVLAATRLAPMPENTRPCAIWQRDLLASFAALQRRGVDAAAQDTPSAVTPDAATWRRRIFRTIDGPAPSAHALARLEYLSIASALSVFDEELPEAGPTGACTKSAVDDGARILAELTTGQRSKWLFALLANLHLPLQAGMAASLRSILRKLTFARLAVKCKTDESLATLNVLIVVLAHHFGQGESCAFETQ